MQQVTEEEWQEFCKTHFVDCPYWVTCDGDPCVNEDGTLCNIWQLNKDREETLEMKIKGAIKILENNGYAVSKKEQVD